MQRWAHAHIRTLGLQHETQPFCIIVVWRAPAPGNVDMNKGRCRDSLETVCCGVFVLLWFAWMCCSR
jgi:hypothetical protein